MALDVAPKRRTSDPHSVKRWGCAAKSCEIVQTGYTGAPLSMLFPYAPRASFAIRQGGSVPESESRSGRYRSDGMGYRSCVESRFWNGIQEKAARENAM